MKRLLAFIILVLSFGITFNTKANSSSTGKGELLLTDKTIDYFLQYIKDKKPYLFLIAPLPSGQNFSIYWYCPSVNDCRFENLGKFLNECKKIVRKNYDANSKCYVFAKKRKIVWKNGINPGKGKISNTKRKFTKEDLISKLTELGFYSNEVISNKTEVTQKQNNNENQNKKVSKNNSRGDIEGFMNALENAKNIGLTIDPDQTAKQFGFNNFEDFFNTYKNSFDIGDVTLDEAKEFLLGADNTVEIVESQKNLDKLHELIINDKYFRKRTGYFKKKYKNKTKLLVVYMNYEKEMAKITKDPNLKKIGRFDFRFRFFTNDGLFSTEGLRAEALADCEASRKKYKLSGGECIFVESRYKDEYTNLLKPRLKDNKFADTKKKLLTAKKKITVDQKNLDKDPPVIVIDENITVNDNNFVISGKVKDKGTSVIYVKADNQDIPVKNGEFKISKYSPVDTKINITAIDEWGNTSKKIVQVKIKKENLIVEKLEPLNPSLIKSKINENKLALIIGIENYSDIVKASYANNDARYFKEYATNVLGIKNNNIKLLVDQEATYIEINKVLKKWLKSKIISGKTELIIYYAGHGLASKDGKELFLLPHDGDADLLSISSISRSKLFKEISDLNPKTVTVFLDACYSGSSRDNEILLASARPVKIVAEEQEGIPKNFTIFGASKLNQISSGLKNQDHGIFSYFLMKGLEGKADANKDKKITNSELLAYMDKNVSQKAAEWGREQNPSLAGDPDKVLINYR